MKELKQMNKFSFKYFDSGYVRGGKFQLVKTEQCTDCKTISGRGFNFFPIEQPSETKFICLKCTPFFLSNNGQAVDEYMELCFFDLSIAKKYADLRKRLMEKAIDENNFLEHRDEYAKYIYSSVMNAINYLVDLDHEYPMKAFLGPKWNGWWLGASGNELDLFFNWLRTSLHKPQFKSVIDKYKANNKDGRVPPSVNECHKVVEEFKQKILVQKKFKK